MVETIFFASQNTFFVETCENFEFSIFFRILLIEVEENYTKNNDLQYFLFQIKIANAILHADEVLNGGALYQIPYNSASNALLHVTQIFFRTSNILENISKTVFG